MSYSGPPGVSSPHPSLPARPPLSSGVVSSPATAGPVASPVYASPATSTPSFTTTPTTTYGPTAPPPSQQQQQQPRLGYSRTYATAGTAGPGAGGYNSGSYNTTGSSYNAYSSYAQKPQAPQAQQSYGPQAPSYGPQAYGPQVPSSTAGSAATYGPQYGPTASVVTAAPVIRNPFPAQGTGGGSGAGGSGYNQTNNYGGWPSGYGPNGNAGSTAAATNAGGYGGTSSAYYGQQAAAAASAGGYYAGAAVTYGPDGAPKAAGEGGDQKQQQKDNQSTVYRSGGGKTWTDDTLLEWDPSHLRLFVGNLAGEVTDETLLKAFSRWKSVQKAVVKRDKWTKKSRGYGFVSFSDADDFFQAAKEMNGKYIGSHPVVVRKSKTEIKVSEYKDDQTKKGKKGAHHGKSGAASAADGSSKNKTSGSGHGDAHGGRRDPYEPALGPVSAGVHKHGKTKNGLKLLG